MNSALLQDAMGEIRDDFIFDAHREDFRSARRYRAVSWRRGVALIAALMLLVLAAIPAMAAADFAPAYDLLYDISPRAAQALKPVHRSCTDKGIQFEVISASVSGDELQAYVAVRDLEGDRIDKTTDLFDSYSVRTPFACTCRCDNIGYDTDTRTATFLITITQWNSTPIPGDKITLQANKLLCQKSRFEGALPEWDLSGLLMAPETTKPVHIFGGSVVPNQISDADCKALVPQGELYRPVDGVQVTAIGYIGGKLHIQIQYADVLRTDNHGYPYFKDAQGEELYCISVTYYCLDHEYQDRYAEYVFDLPEEDLDQYEPFGYFVTADTLVEGNWSITFPVEGKR